MDDSSVHGLEGEGSCLGPAGLWGRPQGGNLASLRAAHGTQLAADFRPQGPQGAASVSLQAGA